MHFYVGIGGDVFFHHTAAGSSYTLADVVASVSMVVSRGLHGCVHLQRVTASRCSKTSEADTIMNVKAANSSRLNTMHDDLAALIGQMSTTISTDTETTAESVVNGPLHDETTRAMAAEQSLVNVRPGVVSYCD